MFNYVLKKIVGTKNQRELKKMQPVVARINERESWAKSLSDDQFREQVQAWRKEVADVVTRLIAALEPEDVVLGGGNVKKLKELPPGCRAGNNANAFVGGFRLWKAATPKTSLPVKTHSSHHEK